MKRFFAFIVLITVCIASGFGAAGAEAASKGGQSGSVSGTLISKMTAKGKTTLTISWSRINGAKGYDIYFAKCGKTAKRVKSINRNRTLVWTKKNLKKKT